MDDRGGTSRRMIRPRLLIVRLFNLTRTSELGLTRDAEALGRTLDDAQEGVLMMIMLGDCLGIGEILCLSSLRFVWRMQKSAGSEVQGLEKWVVMRKIV